MLTMSNYGNSMVLTGKFFKNNMFNLKSGYFSSKTLKTINIPLPFLFRPKEYLLKGLF